MREAQLRVLGDETSIRRGLWGDIREGVEEVGEIGHSLLAVERVADAFVDAVCVPFFV